MDQCETLPILRELREKNNRPTTEWGTFETVVIRHPNDFRYANWQNARNKWWLVEVPPLDCLAAKPVSAASAEQAPAIRADDRYLFRSYSHLETNTV